jgi:hypothetical protein
MNVKSLLLATALASVAFAPAAQADLMIAESTFADLGATGFGNAPRLLTLQNNGFEAGGTVAGAGGTTLFTGPTGTACTAATCPVHQPSTGTNESLVVSLNSLGWTSGANVGIGLDTNETGNVVGLTFDTLVLKIYNSAGVVLGTFSGDGPVNITAAQLAQQQGNGNSVFDIVLSAAERTTFNSIIAANGGNANGLFEGLSASFGCPSTISPCLPSTDGAESFLGFNQAAVPGPIAGAGLPGLVGLLLLGFARLRQKRFWWARMAQASA